MERFLGSGAPQIPALAEVCRPAHGRFLLRFGYSLLNIGSEA